MCLFLRVQTFIIHFLKLVSSFSLLFCFFLFLFDSKVILLYVFLHPFHKISIKNVVEIVIPVLTNIL